jgi:glycerol-3-phosphate acyltransferase PlsY
MLLAGILIVAISYLLGSVPTGYLLVKLFRHEDIRSVGSGNIGATNVLRSGGKGLGAATFALDILKGAAAVLIAAWVAGQFATGVPPRDFEALAAVVAVLGHMFPVWLGFKGGKGVSTGFGVFLVASPLAALAAFALFIVVLLISRYVSLASVLAAASFPAFAWFLIRGDKPAGFVAAQVIVSLLIVLKHHQNIRRLANGTENRFGGRTHERKPA